MQTVKQLLEGKPGTITSIGPEATVLDAVKTMADQDIGSVLVMDGARLAGILTERHYARNVILAGRSSSTTKVSEAMTPDPVCVSEEHTVDECMALMTKLRIRHLPVTSKDTVVGIISIGDLVRSTIADQEQLIDQLTRYIQS